MSVRRRLRRARRWATPGLLLVGIAGGLLLLVGAAVAVSLPGVRSALTSSRSALVVTQDALRRGDPATAAQALDRGRAAAARADRRTHQLPWRVVAHLPVVGDSVRELQAVTRATSVTTDQVLPPLVRLRLTSGTRGRLDATPLEQAQPLLTRAVGELAGVRRDLRDAPSGGVREVVRARLELDDALTRLDRSLGEAEVASIVVPKLLAGDQRFLLAVQNPAEQRATGGLIGAYGVLRVQGGRMALERIGPNQDLVDPDRAPVALGPEFGTRYGRFQADRTWRSANLTPDTPTVGRLLAALWRGQTGQVVDGVVLVDPVALSRLLAVTGPVRLADGTLLTADNAVQVLLVDAYARFPRSQDAVRNTYLAQAARLSIARFLAAPPGTSWGHALAQAVASGHLQVWSSHSDVQAVLARSRAGGAVVAPGPYLSVVTQDVGGSKLGTYLHRTVRYEGASTGEAVDLGHGPVDEEQATITVELRNDAPRTLPSYVTLRPDDPAAPVGQLKSWVSVYLGAGATVLGAQLDGQPVPVQTTTEKGLAVLSLFVTTDRGATSRLVLSVRQPAFPGQPLLWRQQPAFRDDVLVVRRQGAPLDRYYEP